MNLLLQQSQAIQSPGFTIQAAKGNFFRADDLLSRAERTRRRVHSRFGAYVRQRARTSLRKRKGASPSGSPPHSHGMHLLRNFIFFANDEANRSVVIGPALINKPTGATWLSEYGGMSTTMQNGKRVPARYPARPFMRPAFEEELPGLPRMWLDAMEKN